ncbi:MAG TPA: hypothetical protein VF487_14060 [Chitinophagaceae bacterium]
MANTSGKDSTTSLKKTKQLDIEIIFHHTTWFIILLTKTKVIETYYPTNFVD